MKQRMRVIPVIWKARADCLATNQQEGISLLSSRRISRRTHRSDADGDRGSRVASLYSSYDGLHIYSYKRYTIPLAGRQEGDIPSQRGVSSSSPKTDDFLPRIPPHLHWPVEPFQANVARLNYTGTQVSTKTGILRITQVKLIGQNGKYLLDIIEKSGYTVRKETPLRSLQSGIFAQQNNQEGILSSWRISMDFSAYQAPLSPLMIGAVVVGLLFALAILLGIYQGRRAIGAQLTKAGAALFSQIGFFTVVILVFLAISVLESGEFFNLNITHEALFGILGYALALGFDLVSVVCMLARMGAIRMRDERGARLNLLGVMLCAAVSAFANAAASLQGYNVGNLDHTPWWMQQVAPWLGTIFPMMIVILSITTDHIIDHRAPAKGIDLDIYKAQEKRRVDMLHIKLDTERELLTLDRELSRLRVQREQATGRVPREWFFVRWTRPVIPPTEEVIIEKIGQAVDTARQAMDTQLGQAVDTARQAMDTQLGQFQTLLTTLGTRLNQLAERTERHDGALDTLREQVSTLTTVITTNLDTLSTEITTNMNALDSKVSTLVEQLDTCCIQLDTLKSTVHKQLDTFRGQMAIKLGKTRQEAISDHLSSEHPHRAHQPRQMINLDIVRKEEDARVNTEMDAMDTEIDRQVDTEQRILTAQQTLGPSASNRQIARAANCSPTTVAKWLAQQGDVQQEQKPA